MANFVSRDTTVKKGGVIPLHPLFQTESSPPLLVVSVLRLVLGRAGLRVLWIESHIQNVVLGVRIDGGLLLDVHGHWESAIQSTT